MKKLLPFLFLPLLLDTCRPQPVEFTPSAGTANFTEVAFVGDNFLSGYQNGGLTRADQEHSVAAMLTQQFHLAGSQTVYVASMPENAALGWNEKPWEPWFMFPLKLDHATDCQGVTSLMPVTHPVALPDAQNWLLPHAPHNATCMTIPFATTADWFNPQTGANPFNNYHTPFYYQVASNPGVSTIAQETRQAPVSFVTAWLGMENIYGWARHGGVAPPVITPQQFAANLDSILRPLAAQGQYGAIANIPGFRSFPYFTLVPWNGATLTQSKADSLNDIYTVSGLTHISFHEGANGFVIDDPNAPSGVRQMHAGEYITLGVPLDSMKCNYMGVLFSTIPKRYVLDSGEVAFLDQVIDAYNQVIAQKAVQYDFALVDMHAYFQNVQSGVRWDGVDINAEFVTGGFFSLDGYHPHQKGYALITNEFIKAINYKFAARVPTLNCLDCDGVLFPN